MLHQQKNKLRRRIKFCVLIVVTGLFISGVTAFPLERELAWLVNQTGNRTSAMNIWLSKVYLGIKTINQQFPFISYGTDWLAFAHVMLAILFIGPLVDPVKNIWIIQFGIIAAVLIFPLAFIAGGIRGIPFFWQCIDCSFGVITLIVLLPCLFWIKKLEKLT